jgi:hypothetical protein
MPIGLLPISITTARHEIEGDVVGSGRTAVFLTIYAVGAPRPMKMGTITLPWRYDAVAGHALQSAKLRRPTILQYHSWGA